MVISSNDIAHSHIVVINHNNKIICRSPVTSGDYQIIHFTGINTLKPFYSVFKTNLPAKRRFKSNNIRQIKLTFKIPVFSNINAWGFAFSFSFSYLFKLFFCQITFVSKPFFKQFVYKFFVYIKSITLKYNLIVIIKPGPVKSLYNCFNRFLFVP